MKLIFWVMSLALCAWKCPFTQRHVKDTKFSQNRSHSKSHFILLPLAYRTQLKKHFGQVLLKNEHSFVQIRTFLALNPRLNLKEVCAIVSPTDVRTTHTT